MAGSSRPATRARGAGRARRRASWGWMSSGTTCANALRACGLPETLTMYQLGRHTYGAQHVMGGGSLASLREILGHSSVQVTERYGHLRPDLIRPADLLKLDVDLSRPRGEVVQMAAHRPDPRAGGNAVATLTDETKTTAENSSART